MQHAFYPVLLGLLIVASLGVPIPEDIPLIAAGVLLKTQPGLASWSGTILVALIGIMIGDLVLYRLGRVWGPDVVNHRFVRRLITRGGLRRAMDRFRRYGTWFCFFGRFFMGVRAAMCMTAGATRFPYWRFLLADFAGALLSVPFFVLLGYWFAGMIPTLQAYVSGVQWIMLAAAVVVVGAVGYYQYRKIQRRRRVRVAVAERAAAGTMRAPAGVPGAAQGEQATTETARQERTPPPIEVET